MASEPPATGPMQIGDGDVGVYIERGDALVYATALEAVLADFKDPRYKFEAGVLERLVTTLRMAKQCNSEHRRALQKVPTIQPGE